MGKGPMNLEFVSTFDQEVFGGNQDFVTELKWNVRRVMFVLRRFGTVQDERNGKVCHEQDEDD
jgi:hypothetical protein